jgi:quercetin 2,3-dioxygenase
MASRPGPVGPSEIVVRAPESIHRASGTIRNGTFEGRWHFSFDQYDDPQNMRFGNLRVLNDDTLSPGAIWPLHPHTQNEVVTYVAAGEFRHEDEHGLGGVLHQGGVQHTTVGRGLFHSEINHRSDVPMRFIQIWFIPERLNLPPSVEQREVTRNERTDRWLPLVASDLPDTLPLRADGAVFSSFLERGRTVEPTVGEGHGLYLYVLDGGPVVVGGSRVPALGAAEVRTPGGVSVRAEGDSEILGIEANLRKDWPRP